MDKVEGLFVVMFYEFGLCSDIVGPHYYEDAVEAYHLATAKGEEVRLAKLSFLD